MKKKLFFKLFIFAVIGALVTVTSCKDYDDDISNLQDQIDKLATKAELTTQLTTLQSAVTAAQTAATAAQTKADQAATAAQAALAKAQAVGDAALTEAAVKALAKAEADAADAALKAEMLTELASKIAALKTELSTASDAKFTQMQTELNEKVAEIAAKAEEALGLIAGAVFDVELIPSYNGNNEIPWTTTSLSLLFSSATEKANVFSNGIANAITFVKDKQVQTGTSFIIRVSPTNVIVTPEMISFQNSLGQTYDNVKVTKVVPYEGLLTRSTANGGGLWKVFVELENYNAAAFKAATEKGAKKVLFAVAVNNTDEEAPSKVISSYDIDLKWSAYSPAKELFFFVGDKHVKDVNNRYANTSISLGKTGSGTVYEEKTWSGTPAVATSPANTTAATSDNRSGKAVYPAVQGQALKISLTQNYGDDAVTKPTNIRGLYVTLDKDNAIDSAPSELNAWNSYSYTGPNGLNTLNTVVEGTEAEIIINSSEAINDIIGFRVFAVNYDGTLVDPDGKAFYVSLGKEATNWNALNTVVTASDATTAITATNSASVNATLSKLDGATKFVWTTDKYEGGAEGAKAFDAVFTNADGTVFGTNGTGAIANDFSKVTKVHTVATVNNWLAYKDNKVYKGKLVIKNGSDHVLATLEVTFKKELPTAAPKGFVAADGQILNGVHTSFMVPANSTGTAAITPNGTHGMTKLGEIFQFGTTDKSKYTFSFANSDKDSEGKLIAKDVTGGADVLTVAKEFIDNSTAHEATVTYNFGKISTETKDGADYVVPVYNFNIVYSNVYKTYTWNWATRTQLVPEVAADKPLPYETSVKQDATGYKVKAEHIYGVSTTDAYSTLLNSAEKLDIQGAKLISNVSKNEDYFTVAYNVTGKEFTFTAVTKDKLTVNVPSTLVISAKDYYGNDVVIEIPVTVTP